MLVLWDGDVDDYVGVLYMYVKVRRELCFIVVLFFACSLFLLLHSLVLCPLRMLFMAASADEDRETNHLTASVV